MPCPTFFFFFWATVSASVEVIFTWTSSLLCFYYQQSWCLSNEQCVAHPHPFTQERAVKPCERSLICVDELVKLTSVRWWWYWGELLTISSTFLSVSAAVSSRWWNFLWGGSNVVNKLYTEWIISHTIWEFNIGNKCIFRQAFVC